MTFFITYKHHNNHQIATIIAVPTQISVNRFGTITRGTEPFSLHLIALL